MAKKGKKGFRIPKEIGGVKVPKEARRAGEALIERACSPEGRQALTSGLAMAATAVAAIAAKQAREHRQPGASPSDESKPRAPGQGGTTDPHQMGDAIGQAASAFMSKIFAQR